MYSPVIALEVVYTVILFFILGFLVCSCGLYRHYPRDTWAVCESVLLLYGFLAFVAFFVCLGMGAI